MIAGGAHHALALCRDGTVWAWGGNQFGQLGDGTTLQHATPVQVPGLRRVTAISAGAFHSVAVLSDGTVWAWGKNQLGQLGDGTTTDRATPVPVRGLKNITALAAGGSHSLALSCEGTVWGWGANAHFQAGSERPIAKVVTPVQVPGLTSVTALAAGSAHSLALSSDGTVWAWGYNEKGQLGDGTTTDRATPVQALGLTDVTSLITRDSTSMAVRRGLGLRRSSPAWRRDARR
jgi:hypothetical protein